MSSISTSEHGRLQVVLVHPEIPPNTGNIGRLCAAAGVRLHLVRPLGFSLSDRQLRRAGLDYWPHLDLCVHESWERFLVAECPTHWLCYSARAGVSYLDAPLSNAVATYLVFGCETKGLPADVIAASPAGTFCIPIANPAVRSLNLANAVAIVLYDALRRTGSDVLDMG